MLMRIVKLIFLFCRSFDIFTLDTNYTGLNNFYLWICCSVSKYFHLIRKLISFFSAKFHSCKNDILKILHQFNKVFRISYIFLYISFNAILILESS